MPQSKKRKGHHEHHGDAALATKEIKKGGAVIVMSIFFAVIGLGIAYFVSDDSIVWLGLGVVAGAAAGYVLGKQLDRSFSKK